MPLDLTPQTCSTCKYHPKSPRPGYGYCIAAPPTQPNPAPSGGHHYTYKETADDLIACGMWQARVEAVKPQPPAPVLETKAEPTGVGIIGQAGIPPTGTVKAFVRSEDSVAAKPPANAPAPISPIGEKPPAPANAPRQGQPKGRPGR